MHRSLRSMFVATAFALTALSAVVVQAAPTAWENVDVTLHTEQAGSTLMVSGDLPESVKLPAEAELAVPAGSEVQWIGEILGGPPAEDPALEYTKTTVGGVDVYRVTLTKSRTAQIEVPKPGQLFDGSSYSSAFKWTSAQDIPQVTLRLRVPQGAKLATAAPGASMQDGADGYSFYTKTVTKVKAGDELALSANYTVPAAAAGAAAAAPKASDSDAPVLGLFLLVIAGAAVALLLASRRKKAGAASQLSTEATDEGSEVDEGPSEVDGSAERPQAPKGAAKRKLVTAGIIAALVLAAVVAGGQSAKPKVTGDTVTEVFAQGEPCVTATIALSVADGADPGTTASSLFDALRPLKGLNTATYNAKTSSIDVGYCESKSTEDALRNALAPTGLLAPGGAAAPTAP